MEKRRRETFDHRAESHHDAFIRLINNRGVPREEGNDRIVSKNIRVVYVPYEEFNEPVWRIGDPGDPPNREIDRQTDR